MTEMSKNGLLDEQPTLHRPMFSKQMQNLAAQKRKSNTFNMALNKCS